MRRLFPILAVLALLAVPCLGNGKEKTYSIDSAIPFKITLPADWVQVPRDLLQSEFNHLSARSDGVTYGPAALDCAFQKSRGNRVVYPYIVVRAAPCPDGTTITDRDVPSFLGIIDNRKCDAKITSDSDPTRSRGLQATMKRLGYDRRLHLLTGVASVAPEPGSGSQYKAIMYAKLVKTGILYVQCYVDPGRYTQFKPAFDRIGRSVTVDSKLDIGRSH